MKHNAIDRLAFNRFLLAVTILFLSKDAAVAQNKNEIPKGGQTTFQAILNWLPTDTETLVVTKGPFQIEVRDDKKPLSLPLIKQLERFSYSTFGIPNKGRFVKMIEGVEITLAVEGSRAFRGAKSLGLWPYEGCHILVLKKELGPAGEALRKAWAADAKKVQKIEGHDVYSFEEKLEKDLWTFFFAQPSENVLLCATDQSYLTELLSRMAKPKEQRAFPDDLPEWKHVDVHARCWAIRHYGKPRKIEHVESPLSVDPHAVGMTFSHTPSPNGGDKATANVKYFSANKDASEIATKAWTYFDQPQWKPTVRQDAAGVVEIKAEFEDERAQEFFFLLVCHLGHIINL